MAFRQKISHNFTFSTSPSLHSPDGTAAVTSTSKAELFALASSENFTLGSSRHIHSAHPSSDFSMPVFTVFSVLSFV